ncbi:MAG: porin family protein, partial [Methylocystis sp.]
KKILFAVSAVALALSAGSAMAADLPSYKAPPPVYIPPPPMWTGFYAGLNAGFGWGTSSNTYTAGVPVWDGFVDEYSGAYGVWGSTALANTATANINQSGFIGGGQIGYNYQWGPQFVVGLEADIQGASISGAGTSTGASVDSDASYNPNRVAVGGNDIHAGINWMGTVAGRVGYLFTPTLLVYARGGLAYGGVHANVTSSLQGYAWGDPADYPFSGTGTGYASNTLVGWHIGGGLEWMFMPNWSLKTEAFYYDLGSLSVGAPVFAPVPGYSGMGNITTTRVQFNGVVARVGVNYHFNWGAPAPVVAKY